MARADPQFYVWSFPGCPIRVHLKLKVISDLGGELPSAGEGILIGSAANSATRVVDFVPAPDGNLGDLVREHGEERVVGYYRIASGEPLRLNESDLARSKDLFSRPHQVFLRIQPSPVGPANATFFFHDRYGLQGDFPFLEFPMDASSLSATNRPANEAESEQEAVAEIVDGAGAPAADPLPVPNFLEMEAGTRRFSAKGWIILFTALLGALAGLVPEVISRYSPGTDGFVFRAEHRGHEMYLTWDRDIPAIVSATSGRLSIRDGGAGQVIMLSRAQLQDGSFVYTRQSGDVRIDLDVFTPAGKISRTLRAAVPWSGEADDPSSRRQEAAAQEAPRRQSDAPSRWTYFEPLLTICLVLMLAGLVRLRLSRKVGLVWAGVLAFVLVSWPPVEWLLSRPLENPYPVRLFQAPPGLQAIVVLSSAVDAANDERPFPMPDEFTLGRCEFAAWIYRNHPDLPVLASGGGDAWHLPLASTMRGLLRRAGVPAEMIWTEERSGNTYENALYSAEILHSHGIHEIALVVEARSMLRAAACFRKQGIEVVPAPSEFRTWGPLSEELFPNWKTIRRNEATLHELGGLAWYGLKGWI